MHRQILVFAQTNSSFCDPDKITVALINGVNNDKDKANKNKEALKEAYSILSDPNKTKFVALYNEIHLGGIGDLLKTYLQRGADEKFTYVDDYDLRSLVTQLQNDLKTQKLLIVGHSQGTLYANALYETLSKVNGEMKVLGPLDQSIGVYGIGVAATHMEKGNHYVTSDTDAVIKLSRTFMPGEPAPANIHIDESLFIGENEDPADGGRGHGLVPIYLKYQSERIIGDISSIIESLKSSQAMSQGPCLVTSSRPITDYAKTNLFALADPISTSVVSVVTNTVSTTYYLVKQIGTAAYVAYRTTTDTLGTLLSGLFDTTQKVAIGPGSQVAIVSLSASPTTVSTQPSQQQPSTQIQQKVSATVIANKLSVAVPPSKQVDQPVTLAATQMVPASTQVPVQTINLPFLGGGGGGGPNIPTTLVSTPEPVASSTATTTDPVLPPEEPPIFTIDTPTQDSFDTDTINFSGTKTEGADVVVYGIATTTSSGTTWHYDAVVAEGTTTFNFYAYKDGRVSSTTQKTITVSIPDAPLTLSFNNLPGNISTSTILSGTKEKQSTLRISWEVLGSGVESGFAFFGTSTQTKWTVDTLLSPGVYVIHYEYHGSNDGVGGANFIYNPYFVGDDNTALTFTPFLAGTFTAPVSIHATHRMGYHFKYDFSDGTTIQTSPSFANETDIPINLPPGNYGYSFTVYDGANQVVQSGSLGFVLQ